MSATHYSRPQKLGRWMELATLVTAGAALLIVFQFFALRDGVSLIATPPPGLVADGHRMAHSLGLSVLAEGVETEEQLSFLRSRAGLLSTAPLR